LKKRHGYKCVKRLTICRPAEHEMRYYPHEAVDEISELVAAQLACDDKKNAMLNA
jgi:hypothetical protein